MRTPRSQPDLLPDAALPGTDPHAGDRLLRDRILSGDRAAADAWLARHVDALYEFVYYRVGRDATVAEDVVQDALLVAFEKLADFDARSSLHTWLCGIAKNKIRALRRRRRPVRLDELLDEVDPEIDALLARIEREPLPPEVLDARETSDLVGAALSSLPPEYREALVGKYVDGLTVPEMARASGRHVKAFESSLHRARAAFARVFTLLAKRRGGPMPRRRSS